jgi:hypothetical protein
MFAGLLALLVTSLEKNQESGFDEKFCSVWIDAALKKALMALNGLKGKKPNRVETSEKNYSDVQVSFETIKH